MVYVDASALVKLLLGEAESVQTKRFLSDDLGLASAQVVQVELARALRRAEAPASVLAQARSILASINLRRLSDEVLVRAEEIPPRNLRALDAIHLATALDLSPPPDFFLCYDLRLAEAARTHGLAVVSPGADEVHEP